jgi:hypothetical protein
VTEAPPFATTVPPAEAVVSVMLVAVVVVTLGATVVPPEM